MPRGDYIADIEFADISLSIIAVIAGAREGRPYAAMSTMGCDGCGIISPLSIIAGAREGCPYVAMSTMGCNGCDVIS